MTIPKTFQNWVYNTYGDDADTIDAEAYYDPTLTESENRTEMLERFQPAGSWTQQLSRPDKAEIVALERSTARDTTPQTDAPFKEMLRGVKVVCILGGTGSGKTALGHRVTDALHEDTSRKTYVFRHPTPQILPKHYAQLYRFGDVEHLRDCILIIDEPQLSLPKGDKHQNDTMLRLFSLCRQRNITVVIITSDTRYVTRGMESYVDEWLLKDLEPSMVKQGSMAKKIIKDSVLLDVDGYSCAVDEFVRYNRATPQFNGRHKFALPSYWTTKHSKPYCA
jgi:energy-coupling factor transporter ATP-binding protein EcfA2